MRKFLRGLVGLVLAAPVVLQAQPVITSVSPAQGNPGAAVTLSGSGFNPLLANNVVYFGATKATIASASSISLTVNVPLGATYMPVSATNTFSGLMGYSPNNFLQTYDNSAYDATAVNFEPNVDFAAGTNAVNVGVADFDEDGKPDVVVSNSGSNNITVYRNISTSGAITTGSFSAGVNFALPSNGTDVTVGDIDGDGKIDIVTASFSGNVISVFRNTSTPGSISLATRVDLPTNANPQYVAVGDLDMDGKTDIAVTCGSGPINVFRNIGTPGAMVVGSFAPKVNFNAGTSPTQIVIADLDNDAKPEMIITNYQSANLSILHNISTAGAITAGSFALSVNLTTGVNPFGLATGDIDGDGKPEILVSNNTSNTISIYRNISTTGVITSGSFAASLTMGVGVSPFDIAIGDVNGDGKADVAVAVGGDNVISVLRNTSTSGSITASSFAAQVTFSVGDNPRSVVLADMDGDSKPDIVTQRNLAGMMTVLRNNPIGQITGTTTVCVSATTTLNNLTSGGTWESANAPVATIGSLTGVVMGVMAGTALISYNVAGMHITTVVTVSASPDAGTISGTSSVCAGSATTLTTTGSGGVWSSTNTAVGTVSATGVVDGLTAGTTTISYTVATVGCGTIAATQVVTVNAMPTAIAGPDAFCDHTEATYTSSPSGGTWTSSNTGVTDFISLPGVAIGIGTGTATISYTRFGCRATRIVTVILVATPIAGPGTMCNGSTITLSNSVGGATWSSSNTSVVTVAPLSTHSVTLTGAGVGTATVTYTLSTGCWSTQTVTVNAVPNAGVISGATNVCSGSNITLTTTGTGGSWSTASTLEASVGAGTGVVTGSASGTAIITYSVSNSCGTATATHTITVNAIPAVTGTYSVCVGATTALAGTPTGGTWQSVNTAIATVSASGVVTGVSSGVTVISYTNAGCSATALVTVDMMPFVGTLSGAAVFCAGSNITLTSPASGGVWTSSDGTIATVGTSGIVTGVDDGTATITYSISNGCGTATASTVVTVEVTADAGVIGGPTTVCAGGSSITVTNTVSTGTWSSSNLLAAIINSAGVVTSVDPGTTTISYIVGNTCGTVAATVGVTVNALPNAISGPMSICKNATATLASTTSGGSWSSSAPLVISVDGTTGVITGLAVGSATLTYTLVVGCYRTKSVTINALPANISGGLSVCAGSTTALGNVNSGGTWISGNTAAATIGPASGIVVGIAQGTSIITYTRPVTGCTITAMVTVNALPSAMTGDTVICAGITDTFSALPLGGTWTVTVPYYATIGLTTGILSAQNAGTTRITYTTTAGCKASRPITVNQSPSIITGSYTVCEGSTSVLSNTIPFGVWGSSNTAVGIINTSGVVAGISPGTSRVTYTLTNGCSRAIIVTINPLPAPISGPTAVCTGNTIVLTTTTTGGTWSSSNAAVATAAGGTVSGISGGTVAISYTLFTGCRRAQVVVVNASPSNISGTPVICTGNNILLSSTPLTGSWSSSNPSVASVGSGAGLVTGVSGGTAVITYQLAGTGCRKTKIATINPTPTAIGGASALCVGTNTTLNSTPAGGSWSTSAATTANVGASTGIVYGISAGTAIITYRTAAGCFSTKNVTVNPLASAGAILGPPTVCAAATVTLSATVPGGTWAAVMGKVSVNSSGVVTGISAGVDTVVYVVANTCNSARAKYTMTVNPLPVIGTIAGEDSVCVGNGNLLTTTVLGGIWSSSDATIATTGGGMVIGVSPGTAIISYSATNACGMTSATLNVIVIPTVDAGIISGPDTVCFGNSITLASTTPGGMWSSYSHYVTVSATGNVTGVAPGLALIRYVAANVCSTDTAFYNVYVRYDINCPTLVGPQVAVSAEVKLYPTPTHGIVTIEAPVAGELDVYTIDGRKIGSYRIEKNASSLTLPNNIAAGIYMCRFSGEDGSSAMVKIVYEP